MMRWKLFILLLIQGVETLYKEKCNEEEFQCTLSYSDDFLVECIPVDQLCDSIVDCADFSDELGCDHVSFYLSGMREIMDLRCLPRHEFCCQYNIISLIDKNEDKPLTLNCLFNKNEEKCNFFKGREQCHIPFCGITSFDNRLTCDFKISSCGWNIRSNTTFEQTISKDDGILIKVSGNRSSKTVFSSTVSVSDYALFTISYSVNTTKNIKWSLTDEDTLNAVKEWTNKNCSQCRFDVKAYNRITLILWIHGNSKYELVLTLSRSDPKEFLGFSNANCDWNEYDCNVVTPPLLCKPAGVLYDGVRDCSNGADEDIVLHNFPCSEEEIQCKSGKCLPPNSSSLLESQCHNKNTTFLYQLTNTTCPSDYNCKQENVFLNPICLREEEICDGTPHCPHWDDEIACPHSHCPSGCSSCTYDTYRCIPGVVRNIPSQASSIDVSGHVLNLTILCSLARPKLLSLNVSNCSLKDISCISLSFQNLLYLDASNNHLVFPFINPGRGVTIILDGNPVIALRIPCIFLRFNRLSLKHSYIKHIIFGRYSDTYDGAFLFLREHNYPLNFSGRKMYCSLRNVDLSDNEIESLSFLPECSMLKFADVSRNRVDKLPDYMNFYFMFDFVLSYNYVSSISARAFSGMPNIGVLDLSRNRIDSIAPKAFHHNRNLRKLYLNNNLLRHLHRNLLSNLAKLEILKLDGNSIEKLHPEILKNLESLKTLHMSQNKIRYISRGVFNSLTSLKNLDLTGNEIAVREDIFFGLSKLHSLAVGKWSLCCVRPSTVSFENCQSPGISLSSCSYLLQFGYLRVYLCYLMFIICSGHVTFIHRQWKNGCYSSLRNLLVHLSLAHIVIFISFLGMIYKDVESRGEYGLHHEEWMNSSQCHALMVLSIFGYEATTIWSFIISMRKIFSSKIMRNKHKILLIFLTWLVILIIVVVYIILRKFDFSTTSSFEQICVFMPIFYRYDNADADGTWKRKWIYAWIITHSISFVGIFASHIVMAKKHGLSIMLRKMKDPMVLSAVVVAMRDIIICVIVYLQIVMITPDVLGEIILCVIPTCSAIHTIIVIAFKQEQIFKTKEIIPTGILSKFDVQERSEMKLIIVFDRVLKGRIQKKDIVIVFSDGSGWKETTGNLRILKKVLICRAPVYQGNVNKDVVDIALKVKNRSNESIIAHGLIQYDVSQRCTTKARFEIN